MLPLPHSDDEDSSPLLPTTSKATTATPKPSFVEVKWRCGPLCTSFFQLSAVGVILLLASVGILGYITRSGRHHSSRNHWPSNIGYEGPTPTGSEAFAAATAYPSYHDVSPLKPPSTLYPAQDPEGGKFNILHYLGNLSPWRTVNHGLSSSAQVPRGCKVEQVHLLHRHGARYPTSDSNVVDFATKLAKTKHLKASGDLEFLNDWTYKLGSEILTPFGREQLFSLGVKYRILYGHLLDPKIKPVFRTESQDRMHKSALNFAAGFFGIPFEDQYHQLITIESAGFNNTLAPYDTCTNAYRRDLDASKSLRPEWIAKYLADALPRIQKHVEGIKLTTKDLADMQDLCAYELVALGGSEFCDLFTEEEWKGFEYQNDLAFFYGSSFGHPAQAAMGLGWVQEWLARVTDTPLTTFNSTTNSSYHTAEYFPLGRKLYVDATHDTIISAVLTTLNFASFVSSGALPSTHIPKDNSFVTSKISPFAANLHAQILSCPTRSAAPGSASESPKFKKHTKYVRWILNDGVVPLDKSVEGCGKNEDGMCELDVFVAGTQKRASEIDWAYDCLAPYQLGSEPILDGRPPRH